MKLKGRYIKALVKHPCGGIVNENSIGIIINEGDNYIDVDFEEQKGYYIPKFNIDSINLILMPEGFDPNNINKELEIEIW